LIFDPDLSKVFKLIVTVGIDAEIHAKFHENRTSAFQEITSATMFMN